MSLIGAILALIFLDGVVRIAVVAGLLATDAFEIYLWLKWRNKRSMTGPEALVGATGKAISDLDPEGHVRVKGQIWQARSNAPLAEGDEVVVERVDGLRLEVARR